MSQRRPGLLVRARAVSIYDPGLRRRCECPETLRQQEGTPTMNRTATNLGKGIAVFVLWTGMYLGAKSTAAEPAAEKAPPGSAGEYASIQSLPKAITLAVLENGLTVIVQENHVAPVATVRCYVKNTGSAFEGKYLGAGLSHVLEHVVSGGTTTSRSEKEIEKIIDSFGGATNAYTSSMLTAYYIDCPAQYVNTCIELVADSMQHCAFEPGEFERELKVVRQELADGQVNRSRVMWKLLHQTIYTQHPLRHPTIGYLDILSRTTNEAIVDFYRSRYVPNNQVVVVVGDVDTKEVLAEVARRWRSTPRGRETFIPLPDEPEQLSPRQAFHEMDGSTYDLALAWPTVRLSHPDLYALDVAAYILAHGNSSRLVRRLKHEEAIVLSVNAVSYTPHFARGWFGVLASCTPEHFEKAQEEILHDVYRLRDELVGPAELEKAKKQKAAELVFDQQTVQQAAESLGRNYISTGDPLFDEQYVRGIEQVTAEQVRRVARRYLVPQRLNRVVIAPPGGAPQTAAAAATRPEEPVRFERLPNGLRVLIKRSAHLPLVTMKAYLLGSNLVETEATAGRSALVAAMLTKGTPHYSAEQIAEFFDSIGGTFGASAGRSTVYASATVLSSDFPKAFEVFSECVLQPVFPEDEFRKVKQLALGAIRRRADDPRIETFELFLDNLPRQSPYHLMRDGKLDSVGALEVDDLRRYHQQYFVPQNMVVTVFGDVDPEQALGMVRDRFGRLPAAERFEGVSFDRPNQIPKPVRVHKRIGKPTGTVVLGYPGPSVRDEEDFAAITVLEAVMAGYRYPGGWLHNELRGAGLVYYVFGFPLTGPAPGFFVFQSQTNPNKVSEVVDRIFKNVKRAVEGKITEEEFQRAKQMVIALHAQENTTIGQQAEQAAIYELYGLGYDYDKNFDARIEAVTLDDVVRVARKYFTNYVLVTASPKETP